MRCHFLRLLLPFLLLAVVLCLVGNHPTSAQCSDPKKITDADLAELQPQLKRLHLNDANKSKAAQLSNVELRQRDFAAAGSGLPDASVDYVMLFNILHAEERMMMLREAWRVLIPNGKLAVIHWNYDSNTPRGPSMSIRPRSDECRAWAEQAGFGLLPPGQIDLPPYHYGFVFTRPA